MATNLNLDIAQELNITIRRGDTFSFDITVKDANGEAVDLSGYDFDIDVRDGSGDGRENVVLSTSAIGAGEEPIPLMFASGFADGTIKIEAQRVQTEKVPEGSYLYDIQATNSSGLVSQTWFYGSFTVNDDVSDYI